MHRRLPLAAALALLAGARAPALGPHELLVLVNANSPVSREIANHYVRMRGVPAANVVELDLPESVRAPEAALSREDFTARIWEPATRAVRERGLEGTILAWAYSADFPVRIETRPPMSLQGLTFTRDTLPEAGTIATGTFASVLFRGPVRPGGPAAETLSLETFAAALPGPRPLPSMVLAVTGARGLETAEALRVLEYGRLSDGSRPRGRVCLVKSGDVRSRCRDWQFEPAARELASLGVEAVVTSNYPAGAAGLSGLMVGAAWPDVAAVRSFAPGAVAEHLTSLAAVFATHDQVKLTAWLRAGAASSAGTVTEPLSIWTKFPAARLFAHYARGATLLESYYLSIASPTQILLVGDPLARPWAPCRSLTLVALEEEPFSGPVNLAATLDPPAPPGEVRYAWHLDGQRVSDALAGPTLRFDAAQLAAGWHEVRLVAYVGRAGLAQQAFAVKGFVVAGGGRSVAISGVAEGASLSVLRPLAVGVAAEGAPAEVALLSGSRVLARRAGAARAEFTIDPSLLGAGPVECQPAARYPDGTAVRGRPVRFTLAPLNAAPAIASVQAASAGGGRTAWTAEVTDADGDAPRVSWWRPLWTGERAPPGGAEVHGGAADGDGGTIRLAPGVSNAFAVCRLPGPAAEALSVEAALRLEGGREPRDEAAGLVFGWRNPTNFHFFGISGSRSAWVIGACRDGRVAHLAARGAPLRADAWQRLTVARAEDGTVEGRAGEEVVCRWKPPGDEWTGTAGLYAGSRPAFFRRPLRRIGPADEGWVARGARLEGPDARARPVVRASDGFAAAEREAP